MSKVTSELLAKIFPNTPKNLRDRFIVPFNTILPKYGITTEKRFAAFIANVGIESDRLKTTKEYGGESYFNKYNGRKDLGNIRAGDGPRFKGRSVLQTTGRYNYWVVVVAYLRVLTGKNWDSRLAHSNFDAYLKSPEYDKLLKEADLYGVNFLAKPELLEKFPYAVEAAGIFVEDKKLNAYADRGQFFEYAGILNKGSAQKKALHYKDRLALYHLAFKAIPDDFNLIDQDVLDDITDTEVENLTIFNPKNEDEESILDIPIVIPDGESATTEMTKTETTENVGGIRTETTVQQKNEQDVNIPAEVSTTQLYQGVGFWPIIKKDLTAVLGGNLSFQGISELLNQFAGLPEWITALIGKFLVFAVVGGILWLGYRTIHYIVFKIGEWQRVKLEIDHNTNVTRKDIKWVN